MKKLIYPIVISLGLLGDDPAALQKQNVVRENEISKETLYVLVNGDKIVDFVDNPNLAPDFVNSGVYLFEPDIFKYIPDEMPRSRMRLAEPQTSSA